MAKEYFTKRNYNVMVQELLTGDYLFDDSVVFEYKTCGDFLSSIGDGRVFNEAIDQSESYPHHFVVINGTRSDLEYAFKYSNVNLAQYYGAIARLNTYTTVIYSGHSLNECFYQMTVQAKKCLDGKDLKVKQFPVKNPNTAFNVLCYCLNGISEVRAENIVNSLGLSNVYDVLNLTTDDLISVDGIGDKLSESIMQQIKEL